MRKLLMLSVPAIAVIALVSGSQAAPLSATGSFATSDAIQQAMPGTGVTEVRWGRGRGGGRRWSRWCYFHPRACW